jgi:hypothetical protein
MATKARTTAKPIAKNSKAANTAKTTKTIVTSKTSKVVAKSQPAKSAPAKKSTQSIRPTVSGSSKSAKQGDLLELDDQQVTEVIEAQNTQAPQEGQSITGRGVFAVRTLGEAVSVESAFLAEDGNVLRLPAVFPNREYALAQIEELRQIVNQHFDGIVTQK